MDWSQTTLWAGVIPHYRRDHITAWTGVRPHYGLGSDHITAWTGVRPHYCMDWGQTTLLHGLGSDHINVWTGYLYMESKGKKDQEHTHNNVCSYSLRLLELYKLVLKVVLIYPLLYTLKQFHVDTCLHST